MRSILIGALSAILALVATPNLAATLDFEDLALGTVYNSGDNFTTSGVTVTAEDFTFSNGVTTGAGFARVVNGAFAGGSGHELEVNNILLDFAFGNVSTLGFSFGEFGGNLNIRINGVFQNFENFAQLNGMTIGGALVSVINGNGNDIGSLVLTGGISSFALGGQELYVDDFRTSGVVPLPASIAFLGSGLLALLGLRRRTRRGV